MARKERQGVGARSSANSHSGVPTPSSGSQTPNAFHKPDTSRLEDSVYILTLGLTPSISVPLDQMRQEYFPKHLNHTAAHITLFHALPHSRLSSIASDIEVLVSSTHPYHVSTGLPVRIRRGIAVLLDSGEEQSKQVHEELREKWEDWLSVQDNGSWQPHWTVMNKVDGEKEVDRVFGTVRRALCDEGHHGKAVGLELWRYAAGGEWEWVRQYRFLDDGYFGSKMGEEEDREGSSKSLEVLKKAKDKVASMLKSMTIGAKG